MKISLENNCLRRTSILIMILVLFVCGCQMKKTEQIISTDFEETYTSIAPAEITNDIIYNQKTICLSDKLEKIGIFFANYGDRENQGTVFAKVFDSKQELIGQIQIPASEIGDGVYYYVPIVDRPAMGELIEIQVSSTSPANKAVTIWCNDNTFFNANGAKLTIAGEEQIGFHMNIAQIYESPGVSFAFWIVVLLVFVICVFCGIPQFYYNKWKRNNKVKEYSICIVLFLVATVIICLRNMQFITTPIIYAEDGTFLSRQIREGIAKTILLNRIGGSILESSPEFSNVGTYIILWLATKITMFLNGYDLSNLPFWIGILSNMFFAFVAVLGYIIFEKNQMGKIGVFVYLSIIFVNLGTSSSEVFGRALNTQFLWTVPTTFLLVLIYNNTNKRMLQYILCSVFTMIAALSFPVCYVQISGYLVMVLARAFKRRDLLYTVKQNVMFVLTVVFGIYKLPQLLNAKGVGVVYTFKPESIIEFFIGRHILFPLVSSVYNDLTDSIVIVLFAIYILIVIYAAFLATRKEVTIFNPYILFACLTIGTCFVSAFMRRTMTQIFDNYTGTYPDRYFYGCNLLAIALLFYAVWIIMENHRAKIKLRDGVLSVILCLLLLNPNLFYFTNENYVQYLYGEGGFQGTFKQSCESAIADSQGMKDDYDVMIYPTGLQMQLPFAYVVATARSTS